VIPCLQDRSFSRPNVSIKAQIISSFTTNPKKMYVSTVAILNVRHIIEKLGMANGDGNMDGDRMWRLNKNTEKTVRT